MGERRRYESTSSFAEMMLFILEAEYAQGERNVDAMMRRLKDLSAYSLTHAEIMDQREGVEMLALGMFFGMTSNVQLRNQNQSRLTLLTEASLDYQGRAEAVEAQVARRKKGVSPQNKEKDSNPLQSRLL